MRRVAVYFATRNYYAMMAASAKSLLRHTRMDRVWFLIEDDAFPEELPDVIRTKNISNQTWFEKDGPNYSAGWTYTCLLPLAFPEIFPEEDRVLRLDDDVVIEKDIGPLLDMDMRGNVLAMVEEPVRSKFPFRYFNAGVALMDLKQLRETGRYRKMIDLANREQLTAMDQDALNVFCQGEILKLDPRWNDAGHITEHTDDPYITHYAGARKPYGESRFKKLGQSEWRVI